MVLAAAAGPVCSQGITDLEMTGRFALLERAAEAKVQKGEAGTSVLAPLCLAYSKLKRYSKLFPCLDRLEERLRSGDTTVVTDRWDVSNHDANPFANLLRAEALVELGDYAGAIKEGNLAAGRVLEQGAAGMWPPKQYRLMIMGVLGLAHALTGQRDGALKYAKQLEEYDIGFIGSAIQGPLRANTVARIYAALGDYAEALKFVREDEGSWIRTVWFMNNAAWGYSAEEGRQTYVVLPKLLLRGKSLLETGELAGAKQDFDAALRNGRIRDFGELHWIALFERGRIAEREGKPDEAMDFYRRAIEIIELQRASINTEANKIGFVGDKQNAYAALVSLLVRTGRVAEAFDYVERSKARALVDMLAAKQDLAPRAVDPARARELLARLAAADLAAREQDLSRSPEENTGIRSLRQVRDEIRASVPELSSLVTVGSVPLDELRKLLAEGETLLEYYYHGRDLYAFIVTRGGVDAVRLDAAGLAEAVEALRRSIERFASADWQAPARALHARLWQPLAQVHAAKDIIIVAHGALHYLPFATLLAPDGRSVVDTHRLRLLPSASVLKFLRPPAAGKDAPLLALGNPDLGDPAMDLRFAESEAQVVARMFPNSALLTRKDASKVNFRKAAAVVSRIHFATHGKFRADEPLASGLFLAKDGQDDGMLTVSELYGMSLDADLVTLSACETGLGRIANGDDVVGLTRGFLYAGSRSIVASLWSVDDRATSVLMQAFYENLGKLPKHEALRQAQVKARAEYPHPFFWSAFQLTGRSD